MAVYIMGTAITPGNGGRNCMGDGMHFDDKGLLLPSLCSQCRYHRCCSDPEWYKMCYDCVDKSCPNME